MDLKREKTYTRKYIRLSKHKCLDMPKTVSIAISVWGWELSIIGEIVIEWETVTEGELPVPILKVSEDSWKVLGFFTDLFEKMAALKTELQEDEFSIMLDGMGLVDATMYTIPEK